MATRGRPSDYADKHEEFLRRVAEGRTVSSVCRDADMPSRETVYQWLLKEPAFPDKYTRAKEQHADAMADEILSIADTADADNVSDEYGNIKPNHEWINRSRLRVDSRKWLLSKIMPKKYGDKIEQTHVGDESRPMKMDVKMDIENKSSAELLNYILSQGGDDK